MPTKGFSSGFAAGFGGSLNVATVALKVGSVSADPLHYQDGDILGVFNRRQIRRRHAEHICHRKLAAKGPGGLISASSHCRDMYDATHQYRLGRVSEFRMVRTDLNTLETVEVKGPEFNVQVQGHPQVLVTFEEIAADPDFGDLPNSRVALLVEAEKHGAGEVAKVNGQWELRIDGALTPYIIDVAVPTFTDVPLFIERRLLHPRHRIFGTPAAEFWHGGRIDTSHAKLDIVWNAIETKTPHREIDFPDWPAGVQDLKSHLLLRMNDMADADAEAMIAPDLDLTDPDNPITVRKRARMIPWRSHRELVPHIANIDNPAVSVDLRPGVGRLVRTFHDEGKV